MGDYNLTNVIRNQFKETRAPQRNNVATTTNFFFKNVSPGNLAESENLVEAAKSIRWR